MQLSDASIPSFASAHGRCTGSDSNGPVTIWEAHEWATFVRCGRAEVLRFPTQRHEGGVATRCRRCLDALVMLMVIGVHC
jgi:hypothetical protein